MMTQIKCKQLLVMSLFGGLVVTACKNNTTMVKKGIKIIDAEAAAVLDSSAAVETIVKDMKWTEGPLYISDGDYLLFSDVPANKIYKWKEGEGVSVYLYPSGTKDSLTNKTDPGSNGLLLNEKGELVICQQGDRRIVKMASPLNNAKTDFITIADKYNGKKLNSPNDAIYASNGDLYFSDPAYGLNKGINDPENELGFQGVFCMKPDGRVLLVTRELKYPNGLAITKDGKFLYVSNSDSDNKLWMKYGLNDSGLIKDKQLFYHVDVPDKVEKGSPDGMKINKNGYLFAAGPEGIWLFNPTGKLIARINTAERTSNCVLSADEKTLFITCSTYVMRVKLK